MNKSLTRDWPVRAVYALYGAMMLAIVCICLFLPWIAYAYKRETLPNLLLMPLGLAAIALSLPVARRAASLARATGRARLVLLGASALFLAAQLVMISRYYFYTDWDVETIVESALSVITGKDISRHGNYFSMCPNNLVLVTLYSWIARLAALLGLKEHAYFALLVFQAVLCWLTGLLLCRVVHTLTKSDTLTAAAYLLYIALVGLNPWVSIPYSDAVALCLPIAILALYLSTPRHAAARAARVFAIAFLSFFGYRIKPQVLFVFLAIALLRAALALARGGIRMPRLRHFAAPAAAFAAGLLGATLLANTMAASVNVPINPEKNLGIVHYLKMGMHPEAFGAFVSQDVSFSWRCETNAERTAANLRVLRERLAQMGPAGLAKQLIRKTLTNYNDGTFCWAGEGVFYREILPERDGFLSPLLRSVYYSDRGALYPIYANIAQALWMGVLALCAAACLCRGDARLAVVMLTLIALTAFEALFEARARYLFCFAPLYITLAACAMHRLAQTPWLARRLPRASAPRP